MAKRSQIVAYANLKGSRKVTLRQISAKTGVLLSTCSNIIREAKRRAGEPGGNSDFCAEENLVPKTNCKKGSTSILTEQQKQHLVAVTLSDSEHCRMTFQSLGHAGKYYSFINSKAMYIMKTNKRKFKLALMSAVSQSERC